MKDSEAKLQIALIASNVMQVFGVNDYVKDASNYSKDVAGLNQRLRDSEYDIEFALLIAERLFDLASPFPASFDTAEDEAND